MEEVLDHTGEKALGSPIWEEGNFASESAIKGFVGHGKLVTYMLFS
jgi:hypothetical protein